MSDAPLLAFDTSAAHCAAALLLGERVIARSEEMRRGQAERLMPLLQEMLAEEGLAFGDLARIGVGIGPGNFTGIRIAVSAARGLALALDIPAIGISGLAALRHATGAACVALPAPGEMACVQQGDDAPRLVPRADVPEAAIWPGNPRDMVAAIAALAAHAAPDGPPPAPLYLRAADAAPPREAPPRILDAPGNA